MKRNPSQYILLLSFLLVFACSSIKYLTYDRYYVLDREGMEFEVFGSLEHWILLNSDSIQASLKIAKALARKELGQYHIIEPCINKKDSIFRDVEIKVNRLLNQSDQIFKYKIDSCSFDDFTKRRIIEKFGDQ